MKKSLVVALMLSFVMIFSFVVLAENGDDGVWTSSQYWDEYDYDTKYVMAADDKDGIKWFQDTDGTNPGIYTILKELNRKNYYLDRNTEVADRRQELAIDVPTYAYIPCYLKIDLVGNQGTTVGESFGPGAISSTQTAGYMLVFDNEIGGFIDEDWHSLGSGRKAEVAPGPGKYIAGCDMYLINTYGNDDYKYEITSAPLVAVDNSGDPLPIHVRTSLDLGDSWEDPIDEIDTDPTVIPVATMEAGEEFTALHNFRVPYDVGIDHGEYSGTITFRVVSI